jgi:hypothetical protein
MDRIDARTVTRVTRPLRVLLSNDIKRADGRAKEFCGFLMWQPLELGAIG